MNISIDEKFRLIEILRQEKIGIRSINFLRSLLLLKDLTPNSRITIRDLLYLQDFSESDAYKDIMSKQSKIDDIQKQIKKLQEDIDNIKKEQVQVVDSLTIDKSNIAACSNIEKELLYAKYHRQELQKFTQREVSKYCKFPLYKSYSEEAWHNLIIWKNFSLHTLKVTSEMGFVKVAKYYALFDFILRTQNKHQFLAELKGNYEYSEDNNNRMNDWILYNNWKNHKVVPIQKSYSPVYYSDDEESVMSALRYGNGDLFGY